MEKCSATEERPSCYKVLTNPDMSEAILCHTSLDAWQQMIRSCKLHAQIFKTSLLWGVARLPTRNQAVREHLNRRVRHVSKEEAERRIGEGASPKEIVVALEGWLAAMLALSSSHRRMRKDRDHEPVQHVLRRAS